MKKFIVMALLMVASISASAQLYVGGSFAIKRDASANTTQFNLAPEVGYAFNNHWGVGGTLDYDYTYYSGVNAHLFSLSPYARWTFARVADDRLAFFVDGGFGVGFGKYSQDHYSSDTMSVFNLGFKPGLAYSFNKHCSVVARRLLRIPGS